MSAKTKRFAIAIAGIALMVTCVSASASTCLQGNDAVQHYLGYFKTHLRASNPTQVNQDLTLAQEVLSGHTANVQEALSQGSLNPNTVFDLGPTQQMSILSLAVVSCQDGIAQALVNSGADVNGNANFRPLSIAASNGDATTAAFLVRHGAQVDAVDGAGQTPLEVAVRQRQLSTVKFFLGRDPQPNRQLVGGHTLLDLVTPSDDPSDLAIANELRAHGVRNGAQASTN
jgi:ankyrin repeat protein